eukprot:Sdes_comp17289_c0_seq1m6485
MVMCQKWMEFFAAVEENDLEHLLELFTNDRTLVNCHDSDLYTPLHRAAYGGHLEILVFLISHGADLHAVSHDGWSAAHSAIRWNHSEAAIILFKCGADVNAQTVGGLTPLHL